jgi:hypothetical protein
MNAFHHKTSIVINRRCQLHDLNFPDFRVSAISEALRDDVCFASGTLPQPAHTYTSPQQA